MAKPNITQIIFPKMYNAQLLITSTKLNTIIQQMIKYIKRPTHNKMPILNLQHRFRSVQQRKTWLVRAKDNLERDDQAPKM
jgi:hypothetical protein